jgi:hypothetical protein
MYKKIGVLTVLVVFCFKINAQESNLETTKTNIPFFLGIGWSNIQTTGDILGSFDFSFLLYSNQSKRFNIRNSILFDGGVLKNNGMEYGLFTLSEKVNIETISLNELFRYYTFLQGGIGVYGNETKNVFETPLAYNWGVGFGLDDFVEKNASIFFDYTFLYNILDNTFDWKKYDPKFQMGIRYWLEQINQKMSVCRPWQTGGKITAHNRLYMLRRSSGSGFRSPRSARQLRCRRLPRLIPPTFLQALETYGFQGLQKCHLQPERYTPFALKLVGNF